MLGSKKLGGHVPGGTTLISRDTRMVGDIHFSGNLDVEGEVVGNILAEDGKEAMVRVVEDGLVQGEINAPSVMVNGGVKGNVYAGKHLELASGARVEGDVHYHVVEMAAGAEVNGRMMHRAEAFAPGATPRLGHDSSAAGGAEPAS